MNRTGFSQALAMEHMEDFAELSGVDLVVGKTAARTSTAVALDDLYGPGSVGTEFFQNKKGKRR